MAQEPTIPKPGDFAAAAAWMRDLRDRGQTNATDDLGLREQKKRQTRQLISDTATWMFCEHGFDAVRVADIAGVVGVSEKTIYNYFPTKESMVFDREEEITEQIVSALRERDRSTSPVEAVMAMMRRTQEHFGVIPQEAVWMIQAFDDLLNTTPALVAAQRGMTKRIVLAVAETLAEGYELDPRDPEPQIVAHALMGLWETREASLTRHIDEGLWGEALTAAVTEDVNRASRLLETGLWAFNHVTQTQRTKRQLADAASSLDDARKQIAEAMRQAREAWRTAREAGRPGDHQGTRDEHREAMRDVKRDIRREVQNAKREAQQAAMQARREAQAAKREGRGR
jgi:AcrR family transcriptional regulator